MKNYVMAGALVALSGLAQGDTVAYWGFNDQGLPGGGFGFEVSDFPFNADLGSGVFTLENFNDSSTDGVFDFVQSFAGTDLGSLDGVSGGSFAFQGATDQTNNGAQAVFSFDGALWMDLDFQFARRGTSTGFNDVSIELFDGVDSLGVVDTLGAGGSWNLNMYDISALDGVADASIVFTFDGATSSNGNNRLDNVLISGTVIPAPGSMALLAIGGLVGVRRRR